MRYFQKQVGGALALGDNLDYQIGSHGQGNLFEVDTSEALGPDKGHVGPADRFAEQLKIRFARDAAESFALNESPKPGIELVPDFVVQIVWRWRHDEFSLTQLVPYALGFIEGSIAFDAEQSLGTHFEPPFALDYHSREGFPTSGPHSPPHRTAAGDGFP